MNDLADFQQRADDDDDALVTLGEALVMEHRRQQQILQALMNITSAGFRNVAELFAAECGLHGVWKQQMRPVNG